MKKRRTLIISLLLIAALALGIGYAALGDDLEVEGYAKITGDSADKAFAADIYFTKAIMSAEKGTAEIIADSKGEAADKVKITVNDGVLGGQGDSVMVALEISNVGDLDAYVTLGGINVTNSEYFAVTTSWGTNNTQSLAKGSTLDCNVTITVLKTPTADIDTTFTIGFTAETVDTATTIPASAE